MDILKFIFNELCCFFKAGFDISIQKLHQFLIGNKSGL